MEYVFSASEIALCDKKMLEKGYTQRDLVVAAAKAVYSQISKMTFKKVLIIAGGGNNGNDGRELAKLISGSVLYENLTQLSDDYDIIIDAIFGTGLNRNVEGKWKDIIEKANCMSGLKIAIDIPSGLNCDNGSIMGCCFKADITYTFVGYKYGQLFGDGRDMCGEIHILDIGVTNIIDNCGYVTGGEEIEKFFKKRKINSHKGTYGKTAVYAGSSKYFGAGVLSCSAEIALKSGVGYCYLMTQRRLIPQYRALVKEAIILDDRTKIKDIDSIAVGMGLGNGIRTERLVKRLLKGDSRLIMDADALNYISKSKKDVLKKAKCPVILTPHIMEFSRLIKMPKEQILQNPIHYAKQYARQKKVVLVLKGNSTIITDGERICVNIMGSPALAKAGSGDVLSGVLCALLARGEDIFRSVIASDVIFKRAGENAAKRLGEYSVLASDVIEEICKVNLDKRV